MSLIAGLKLEGIVKWRGLKSQGPLYVQTVMHVKQYKFNKAAHTSTSQLMVEVKLPSYHFGMKAD